MIITYNLFIIYYNCQNIEDGLNRDETLETYFTDWSCGNISSMQLHLFSKTLNKRWLKSPN